MGRCFDCEKWAKLDLQTQFCSHCLALFCRKCRDCGCYYMYEDSFCHACFVPEEVLPCG